jgi:hypothetical protein
MDAMAAVMRLMTHSMHQAGHLHHPLVMHRQQVIQDQV